MKDLGDQLKALLGGSVSGLVRLSGGASRETWAFELDGRKLILQRERPGAVRTGGGMVTEAELLRAAAAVGVPVAKLVTSGGADSPLGAAFLVSEWVEGETIPRKLLRDDAFAAVRPRLAAQCGDVLAAVHRIPVDAVEGLVEIDQVRQFREILEALDEPHPAFELGFGWLDANRPGPGRVSVVHGDFRNGNLMIGPDGIRAVIDWELAHLGDPMEDLGWLCVRAWRFGSSEPVGGFGPYEDLFAAYGSAAGVEVDPEVVRWWEVLGTLKWGVMCMIQARTHLDGLSRSVELATIGRRVCENEYDLLRLILDSRRTERRSAPPDASSLYVGRPTAAELVEAVREFLEGDVRDATDGRVRFHARVAVNALAIVERELARGPHQDAARADEAALAAAIRSGQADDSVAARVWDDVVARLSVANPGYF